MVAYQGNLYPHTLPRFRRLSILVLGRPVFPPELSFHHQHTTCDSSPRSLSLAGFVRFPRVEAWASPSSRCRTQPGRRRPSFRQNHTRLSSGVVVIPSVGYNPCASRQNALQLLKAFFTIQRGCISRPIPHQPVGLRPCQFQVAGSILRPAWTPSKLSSPYQLILIWHLE